MLEEFEIRSYITSGRSYKAEGWTEAGTLIEPVCRWQMEANNNNNIIVVLVSAITLHCMPLRTGAGVLRLIPCLLA